MKQFFILNAIGRPPEGTDEKFLLQSAEPANRTTCDPSATLRIFPRPLSVLMAGFVCVYVC